jgi:predicted DNA-binding protein (MmcQ/YjbR family)
MSAPTSLFHTLPRVMTIGATIAGRNSSSRLFSLGMDAKIWSRAGTFETGECMKKLTSRLIAYCRSLPHATEDIKWGKDLVFSVGGKMFAVFDAEEKKQFSFKATPENFDLLTQTEGVIPAPYAARFHWVAITRADALPHDMLKVLMCESYHLVADKLPAKVRKQLGLGE